MGAYLLPKPRDALPPSDELPGEPRECTTTVQLPSEPRDALPPSDELPSEPRDALPPSDELPSEPRDALPLGSVDHGGGIGDLEIGEKNSGADSFVDDHDDPHPMEEMPEKRARDVPNDDAWELRGLSQEEFNRIFDEVGPELDYSTVYVVRPLTTRTSSEVTTAVQELVLKLRAEGLHISRVHSDRARELRVEPLRKWLLERGVLSTYTEGQASIKWACGGGSQVGEDSSEATTWCFGLRQGDLGSGGQLRLAGADGEGFEEVVSYVTFRDKGARVFKGLRHRWKV